MDNKYFTKTEASKLVGLNVEALSNLPSVPFGTKGKIKRVKKYLKDGYVIIVQWNVDQPVSLYDIMIGDFSLNFYKRTPPITNVFSKLDFDLILKLKGD
jgi:hypothetical protein